MFDGRDKIQASYPITMTRGGYAQYPGSLLAGAVDVHPTESWGTEFQAPVGRNTVAETETFEWSRMFIMAKEANTVVDLPDGKQTVLGEGQSYSFSVNEGDYWKTSKPVQADLCVGDVGSNYEMRWFSLLPVESWSSSYFSSVGDSYAYTKMVVYNPSNVPITVELMYRPAGVNQLTTFSTETYTIESRKSKFTRFVPTNSGGLLTLKKGPTGAKFIALSVTDTQKTDAAGEILNGQCYDWGYPVVPVNKLTPQVVIGWGYGCTDNDCTQKNDSTGKLLKNPLKLVPRSVVWLSPLEDADVYIDYQNTGANYEKISMKKLESRKLRDGKDTDMSGAVIFATKPGSGPGGMPVDIAAAWGQDPAVSRDQQSFSLDLGTAVLPFPTIRVQKIVDKKVATTGDILTYTIKIQNVGQTAVMPSDFTVFDPMMGQASYITGSTKYSVDDGKSYFAIDDDKKGMTPYPLDEGGLPSQRELVRRGGTHHVQFQVLVDPAKVTSLEMVNTGWVEVPYGPPLGFQADTRLEFRASIEVTNLVYKGEDGEGGCTRAVDFLEEIEQTAVTYCFKITNTGSTYLDWVTLTNSDLNIPTSEFSIPKLAPGDWITVTKKGKILSELKNTVVASGFPVFYGGGTIPGMVAVQATDPSTVKPIAFNPSVKIENTLYAGHDGPATCNVAGVESVRTAVGTPITYCFKVTNTGNTYLTKLKIVDPIVGYVNENLIPVLPPGESVLVAYAGLMPDLKADSDNNLDNMATVTATPSFIGGDPIGGLRGVSAEDPSAVQNTVVIDTRSGEKAPYVDPKQPNCMEDAWEDAGNSQNLVCRAKEVFLNDIHATKRGECKLNDMITLTVDASIHFNSARYDPGWYVARDGGDALRGKCTLSGLLQKHSYNVMSNYGTDAQVVGSVVWNKDFKEPNDKCGDVITDGGGGADILVPFMENVEVKCVDQNNDGVLDISVCFSWRVAGNDGKCTLDMTGADGLLPDLYPATPSKCFCARYDIGEITVVKPTAAVHISPC